MVVRVLSRKEVGTTIRSKFTEEQIAFALRQHDAGNPVAEIFRQIGVSEATFYASKKKCAHIGVSELRELRQLREENTRLKRLVADLTLDKQLLTDVVKKCDEAGPSSRAGAMDLGSLSRPGLPRVCSGSVLTRGLVSHAHGAGPVGIAGTNS